MSPPELRIGVVGYGTVGRSFIEAFAQRRYALEHAAGVRLTLSDVAVREPRSEHYIADARLHNDAASLASSSAIDILVEVSGAAQAGDWIVSALDRGAAVVTANKRALAIVLRSVGRRCSANRPCVTRLARRRRSARYPRRAERNHHTPAFRD
jgi:homoserine dehydrogenase